MWPWEHVAVGYLALSLCSRLGWDAPPSDRAALAVVFGTLAPDLVDKPLGWVVGVLPSGRSMAHSLLFAVPLLVAVTWLTRDRDDHVGAAFALGYLSHLPADVLSTVLLRDVVEAGFLLWPVVHVERNVPEATTAHVLDLFADYVGVLTTPAGRWLLVGEVGLIGVATLAWVVDGTPVFPRHRTDEGDAGRRSEG